MKLLGALLLCGLLVAGSASGQTITQLAVDPPDPTTRESVTLTLQWFASCVLPPDVKRTGFEIDVTLRALPCGAPPVLVTQQVDLGMLPSGAYHVLIENSQPPATLTFTVFDGSDAVNVKQSIGSTAGGTTVNVVVSGSFCQGRSVFLCANPVITFGGTPATDVRIIDGSHFRATTPPHAPGAVQVVVKGDSLDVSSFAFRYYDPAQPPSARLFEKVLVPVVLNGPGANGSVWQTELIVRNDNDFPVEPWRAVGGASSIAPLKPLQFGSGNQPGGMFLVVPREASAALTFHETARDTSLADFDFGTDIPVVRERDFSTVVELLGVPVDPRYRVTLRIYSPVSVKVAVVSVYAFDDGVPLRNYFVPMSDATEDVPAFASVPITSTAARFGIRVAPASGQGPIWAFVTVTNNETQHVTVIAPH